MSDYCEFCGGYKQIECNCCTNCRALNKHIIELELGIAKLKAELEWTKYKPKPAGHDGHLDLVRRQRNTARRERDEAEDKLDKLQELAQVAIRALCIEDDDVTSGKTRRTAANALIAVLKEKNKDE